MALGLYNLTTTRVLLPWPRGSPSSVCKKHLLHKGDEAECGTLISSPRPFKLPVWCGSERQANGFKCMTAIHYCVPNENAPFITAPASSTIKKMFVKWWQLNRIQSLKKKKKTQTRLARSLTLQVSPTCSWFNPGRPKCSEHGHAMDSRAMATGKTNKKPASVTQTCFQLEPVESVKEALSQILVI